MDKKTRNSIYSMVLKTKTILEQFVIEILEKKYGINRSGSIDAITKLVKLSEQELIDRHRLITKCDYLIKSGMSNKEAIQKLIKDVAYTVLNQLAILRLINEKDIIEESLQKDLDFNDSICFKNSFLQESPSDLEDFYQSNLKKIFDNLAVDLLLDLNSVDSVIRPPFEIIQNIWDLFSNNVSQEIWQQEETIGWIYQYFFKEEKEIIRAKSTPRDLPRNPQEIVATNQFYTPSYIVKFLVDNSLGRLWKEMHPSSTIERYCDFLILDSSLKPKESIIKDPTQLKIIDPACGSGHFLLYCFDVLLQIYKEAIDHNWTTLTKQDLSSIPKIIVQNNLFGIDIDRQALQLANLALFLKFKQINKQAQFPRANIIFADTTLSNDQDKEKLKKDLGSIKEINVFIDKIWDSLTHSRELGSILGLSKEIDDFISQQLSTNPRESHKGKMRSFSQKYWGSFKQDLLIKITDLITNRTEAISSPETQFRNGISFLKAITSQYDVVVMNPPYGKPTQKGKNYLKHVFPSTCDNILCAFIENWLQLLDKTGILATIVDNTFMKKSSYEKFRQSTLLDGEKLFIGCDLGWGVLDGAQVATIALCARNNSPRNALFINLTNEKEKEIVLRALIHEKVISRDHPLIFSHQLEIFRRFPNSTISYWIPAQILRIMEQNQTIDPYLLKACQGLVTAEASRFHRFHWEVRPSSIGKGKKWIPFANGGHYSPFYRPLIEVVNWENNGTEIRNFVYPPGHKNAGKLRSRPQNRGYYFREGITWGKRTDILSLQYLPQGCIFSIEGQAAFFNNPEDIWYALGLLNSDLMVYVLNTFCGQHKYSGYVGLLPFKMADEKTKARIGANAKAIHDMKLEWDKGNELSPFFDETWLIKMQKNHSLEKTLDSLLQLIEKQDSNIQKLHTEINDLVCSIYGLENRGDAFSCNDLINRPQIVLWDLIRGKSKEAIMFELVCSLISYIVGSSFGYIDDPDFKQQAFLVNDNGHPNDLVQLIKKGLERIFPGQLTLIERILDKSLEKFLISDFFMYHIQKYKKKPIFWQFSTSNKEYAIWIYSHLLETDYLHKINNELLEPKIKSEKSLLSDLEREIVQLRSSNNKKQVRLLLELQKKKQRQIRELEEFRQEILRIMALNLPFDIDDGVKINIAPFHKLILWNEPEKTWKKLQRGEFQSSSLSKYLRATKFGNCLNRMKKS
ncbi:MAG: BREX-1 system adenine-specific DNA-methyltransferase PglX [Candidatus Hermodarchaeota archaeon]